jgi:hypothetical protein
MPRVKTSTRDKTARHTNGGWDLDEPVARPQPRPERLVADWDDEEWCALQLFGPGNYRLVRFGVKTGR